MILTNKQSIRLIGFSESSITQAFQLFISQEFTGDVELITPDQFEKLKDKKNYSYMVAFTLDQTKRIEIIDLIEQQDLDCATYIHNSVFTAFDRDQIKKIIGDGTFVFPNAMIMFDVSIGKHCIIESYVVVGHHVSVKNNCHISLGSLIAGKTKIGKNCQFKMRSTTLPGLTICDHVELGAVSTFSKNISHPGQYVGTPARRVGDIKEFKENNHVN
jgi:acetyltransferase-like isoleucine patch superfamily enzyme